jgi:flagellar FliL protein
MPDETPKETTVPAASPSKTPLLVGLVNALLTGAVLAILLTRPAGSAAAAKGEGAEPEAHGGGSSEGKAGPTLKLADFVIHLRNPEAERFARLSVELELGNELDHEKLTPYVPRLRDAFVTYLSDRTAEELAGSEALNKAKAALLKLCEELIPGKHVRALYFTDIVVQ